MSTGTGGDNTIRRSPFGSRGIQTLPYHSAKVLRNGRARKHGYGTLFVVIVTCCLIAL